MARILVILLACLLSDLAQAADQPAKMSNEARQLTRGCNRGDASDCINLGILYRHGHGVDRDARKALELFVAACEKGNTLACAFTGDMAYLGSGVSPNTDHGQQLMRSACSRRNEWACETLKRHGLLARRATS
jgi:TPR repeat protein